MRFHFDAHQTYQLRAINSVARLFDGMARETYSMAVRVMGVETQFDSSRSTLDSARLLKNIQDIQKLNGLPPDERAAHVAGGAAGADFGRAAEHEERGQQAGAGTDMYSSEAQKVKCGSQHFNGALGINYRVVSSADELPGGKSV